MIMYLDVLPDYQNTILLNEMPTLNRVYKLTLQQGNILPYSRISSIEI